MDKESKETIKENKETIKENIKEKVTSEGEPKLKRMCVKVPWKQIGIVVVTFAAGVLTGYFGRGMLEAEASTGAGDLTDGM
jgi:hypothetical protein